MACTRCGDARVEPSSLPGSTNRRRGSCGSPRGASLKHALKACGTVRRPSRHTCHHVSQRSGTPCSTGGARHITCRHPHRANERLYLLSHRESPAHTCHHVSQRSGTPCSPGGVGTSRAGTRTGLTSGFIYFLIERARRRGPATRRSRRWEHGVSGSFSARAYLDAGAPDARCALARRLQVEGHRATRPRRHGVWRGRARRPRGGV